LPALGWLAEEFASGIIGELVAELLASLRLLLEL
jgi:hypothetical protein